MCLLAPRPARAAATLLRRPYLQNVQGDFASILWTTLENRAGDVLVGRADGTTFSVPAFVSQFPPRITNLAYTFYQYQADLSGLAPGTEYAYRVRMDGVPVTPGPALFRTAAPGDFSFLAFGDTGENTPSQRSIVARMLGESGISLLLHTGDLAYPKGDYEHYESAHFGLNAPLLDHLPFFPTPGNHDYYADNAAPYLACHSLPDSGVDPADRGRYYSFDWGDAHFTSIDSNLLPGGSADRMLAWVDHDLASTRKFWKIVFLHHPPYPTGHHKGDAICAAVRARVNPIVERHRVQLVLAGHEHGYERTLPLRGDQLQEGTGTTYIITGGGGAGLHDVNPGDFTVVALQDYNYLRVDVVGRSLTVRATDAEGTEIDRVVLNPAPVISNHGVVTVGDYTEVLAPGSLTSIFGSNLAVQPAAARGFPLPHDMGGVRVQLDEQDVPLLFVSPEQVNFQVPYDSKDVRMLRVITPNGMAEQPLKVSPTAPAILAVTTRDALVSAANAPQAGSAVVVYVTGLGRCRENMQTGASAPTPSPSLAAVDVWVGDRRIQPFYAGVTPGFAGLYQVNFTVADGISPGNYPLRIATPDGSSRSVPIPIR